MIPQDDRLTSTSWSSVEVRHSATECPFLVICDHATNLLPGRYGALGLDPAQLERHIAYDIGARGLALELARHLGATYVGSRFSRLLIDPNRGAHDPTLIMRISDGAVIPANARIGQAETALRLATFYDPYHTAISAELDRLVALGLTPIILSIHSYTDVWRGMAREWHCGILWDRDPRLARPLIEALRAPGLWKVGDNEPYSGRLKGDCLYRHGTLRGFPHALIEVRQDLIRDESGQSEWAGILAEAIDRVCAQPTAAKLSGVAFFGSHTDL